MAEAEIILISIIKKKDILYDMSKGSSIQERNSAWQEVAKEMNWPVEECKKKWKSLRASYSRHLKEVSQPGPTKNVWHLAKAMSFLCKHMSSLMYGCKRDPTIDECQVAQEQRVSDQSWSESSSTNFLSNDSSYLKNSKTSNRIRLSEPSACDELNNSSGQIDKVNVQGTSRLQTPAEKLVGPMIAYFKSQTPELSESEQAFMDFVRGLLPEYNQLSERKKRLFKKKVMTSLYALVDE